MLQSEDIERLESIGVDRIECKECSILREWLEHESKEKRYYQNLLLAKGGLISDDLRSDVNLSDFVPVVNHRGSLSQIRKELERQHIVKPAETKDLSEAERIFQASLNRINNGQETAELS